MSEGLPEAADAVVAAIDVASWAVEAAKYIASNHQDFQRAAALNDVRRDLDRLQGTAKSRKIRAKSGTGELQRVIPVNRKAGHVTVVSVEVYEHQTIVRYLDDRGFDRLRDRELRLADDVGTTYMHHGGAVTADGEGTRARGEARFEPNVNSGATALRFTTEPEAVEIPL